MPVRAHEASEYLRTPEDVAAYLNAAIEESDGDPRLLMKAFRNVAAAQGGVSTIARRAQVDRVALSRGLSGNRGPPIGDGDEDLGRVTEGLRRLAGKRPVRHRVLRECAWATWSIVAQTGTPDWGRCEDLGRVTEGLRRLAGNHRVLRECAWATWSIVVAGDDQQDPAARGLASPRGGDTVARRYPIGASSTPCQRSREARARTAGGGRPANPLCGPSCAWRGSRAPETTSRCPTSARPRSSREANPRLV